MLLEVLERQIHHLAHQRTLSRAIIPQNAKDFALVDLQRNLFVSGRCLAWIILHQVLNIIHNHC